VDRVSEKEQGGEKVEKKPPRPIPPVVLLPPPPPPPIFPSALFRDVPPSAASRYDDLFFAFAKMEERGEEIPSPDTTSQQKSMRASGGRIYIQHSSRF
jgi:hypothetical protein